MSYEKLIYNKYINSIYLTDGKTSYEVLQDEIKPFSKFSYRITKFKFDSYSDYITQFDAICKKFDINPKLMSYRLENLARTILYNCLKEKNVAECEELDEFEKDHAMQSNFSFAYANTTIQTNENTVTYDKNNYYNSAFWASFDFLTKKGAYKTLTEIPKDLYKISAYFYVQLSGNLPVNYKELSTDKLWLNNYDIMACQAFNTDIKLIEQENNAYVYEKEQHQICAIFRSALMKLHRLRDGSKLAKSLAKIMHGVFFLKNETIKIPNGQFILDEYGDEVEGYDIKIVGIMFNHNRNISFFYSSLRLHLLKDISYMLKNNINVFRVYTDSIACDKNDYMDAKITPLNYKYEKKEWNNRRGYFPNSKRWIALE